jgi:nucleoside-diphosphate-sugar epimerase
MSTNALIGFTGFVGSTLLKQTTFAQDALFRSTNIAEIENREFDTVVCAGAPAQKWLANKNPEDDLEKITALAGHLSKVRARRFILISTVDVFKSPIGVDETTPIEKDGLHPYGLHRRVLEEFVEKNFPQHLVVRLPGLVGPGLRKNIIYDFHNDNNTHLIDSRHSFQFYPMVNLWPDIEVALSANLSLIHLTAAPITVREIAEGAFAREFRQQTAPSPIFYDMRSIHSEKFAPAPNVNIPYQYDKRATLLAVRAYAQSEPRAPKN